MSQRVLRLLRGRLRSSDAELLVQQVRDEVLPASEALSGLEARTLGVREEVDGLALVAASIWRNSAALDAATDGTSPTSAFSSLAGIVEFEPAASFDLTIGDAPARDALRSGAIGLVVVTIDADREPEVRGLIERQREAMQADGLLRALLVGRRPLDGGVEIAAVAAWPDRDAIATFLDGRAEGPGIDGRLAALSRSLRFEVFDLVDPSVPAPEVGAPAVLAVDDSRRIVDASRGLGRLLGTPPEGLLGRRLDDLLPSAERERLPARWQSLLEDGRETSVVRLLRADGTEVAVRELSLARVPAPGLHGVLFDPPESGASAESIVREALGGWRVPPVPRRRRRAAPLPRLMTLPSGDRLFARFTQVMLDTFERPSMRRLQLHLRGLYPHAVVHRRELAAEAEAWYVFRDGRVRQSPLAHRWWQASDTARALIDADGRIVDSNAAAAALYGVPPGTLIGHDARGLGVAGSYDDFALLLALAFEEDATDSSVRLTSEEGHPVDIVFHAERHGSLLEFSLAPVPSVDGQHDWFAPLCLPPSDETFIARVEDLCERLAPRSRDEVASELEVRLQVPYPNATVRPLGHVTGFGPRTEVLLVHRDGDPTRDESWWTAPETARIRIESGRYVDANDAAVALHGVSRTELLASPLGRFRMSGDERLLMRDVLNRTGSLHTTTHLERGDGEAVEVEFRAVVLLSEPRVVEVAMRPVGYRTSVEDAAS